MHSILNWPHKRVHKDWYNKFRRPEPQYGADLWGWCFGRNTELSPGPEAGALIGSWLYHQVLIGQASAPAPGPGPGLNVKSSRATLDSGGRQGQVTQWMAPNMKLNISSWTQNLNWTSGSGSISLFSGAIKNVLQSIIYHQSLCSQKMQFGW